MKKLLMEANRFFLKENVPIQAVEWVDEVVGLIATDNGFVTVHTFAPKDVEWVSRRLVEIRKYGIHKDRSSFYGSVPVP